MVNGGFGGPLGRRQRDSGVKQTSGRRQHSVERALSASPILPTFAFAALGTVTVLLVALMGMSPLGAVVGPSARDGGRAVTSPRMSVSIAPRLVHRSASARGRETTEVGVPPTVVTAAVEVHSQDDLVATVAFSAHRGSQAKSALAPALALAPAAAATPVPAAGSTELQSSKGPATQATGGGKAFGQVQAFAADDRADESSRQADKASKADKVSKPVKASHSDQASKADKADKADNPVDAAASI